MSVSVSSSTTASVRSRSCTPDCSTTGSAAASSIAPQWVLTAAHCISDQRPGKFQVTLGTRRVSGADQGVQPDTPEVAGVYWHSQFGPGNNTGNDIGLIRLARAARNAPLPMAAARAVVGDRLTLYSFGPQGLGIVLNPSPFMQKADFDVIACKGAPASVDCLQGVANAQNRRPIFLGGQRAPLPGAGSRQAAGRRHRRRECPRRRARRRRYRRWRAG